MSEPHLPAPAHETGHETKDVNFNAIFGLAVLVIVMAVVIHLGIWFVFQGMRERQNRGQSDTFPLAVKQKGPGLPPPPQLEGIERMKEPWGQPRPQEPKLQNKYEWIDRKAGIVRIPMDRAMALIVERKLIPSKEKASRDLRDPYAGLPSPANSGRPPQKE
jgi:hypothetical protein